MEANTFRREEREKAGCQQQLGHDAHAVVTQGLDFPDDPPRRSLLFSPIERQELSALMTFGYSVVQ